jgi:biotin operon repressor
VRLPAAYAPTGRPLRDDEHVDVVWTVHDPADNHSPTAIQRRRHRLVRLLEEADQQGAAATIEDLASVLEVSAATVRRDLAALRDDGRNVRTRGARAV